MIKRIKENKTIVLLNKSLEKKGSITNVVNFNMKENFNSANDIYFEVYYELNGIKCTLWEDLKSLKVIHIPELNENYEVSITLDSSNNNIKKISGTSLCESELSQIMLYNIEINTESDILREEYEIPTTLWNPNTPSASLLHRLLQKAPHYTIGHVDSTVAKIQKSFSFNDKNIKSAFDEITTEIGCIFIYDSINRKVNVFDLYDYCQECGHRAEDMEICPKCNSVSIVSGYGDETPIVISKDNVAETITITDNVDQVKNAFKLKAGDSLMTATIRNLNPNGTDYIYYFSDDIKEDMPMELVDKLSDYDKKYDFYNNEYIPSYTTDIANKYNALADKYNDSDYDQYKYNDDDEKVLMSNDFSLIDYTKKGYDNLINLYYSVIDFKYYLESSLLPTVIDETTNAAKELDNIFSKGITPLGLSTVTSSTSQQTAESAIKNYINFILSKGYTVTLDSTSFDFNGQNIEGYYYCTWRGTITIYKYSDKEDTITSNQISIVLNDNYELFLKQKIEKELKDDNEVGSISGICNIPYSSSDTEFKNELKFYSKNRLYSFSNAYQAALDILAELGQGQYGATFYEQFYVPYFNRKNSIDEEYNLREIEGSIIDDVDNMINDIKNDIAKELDLEMFLGTELWKVFNSYRREQTFENQNYVSTELNNAQMISRANQFIEIAKNEIVKASTLQVSISGSYNNFLLLDEFKRYQEMLELGCWIRILVQDKIYKVRLLSLSYDENSLDKMTLTFSTTTQYNDILSDVRDVLNSAKSISSSYSYVQRQADNAFNTTQIVDSWITNGLDLTNMAVNNDNVRKTIVQDKNGFLIRSYDDIESKYGLEQLRITNSSILVTNDNWRTVKSAIGKYIYIDSITGLQQVAYGVNAETVIGQLILGEVLKLANKNNTLIFDENGLTLNATNKTGVFEKILKVQRNGVDKLYIDDNGNIVLADMTAINGNFSGAIKGGTINIGSRFNVDSSGNMTASNANITGGSLSVGSNFKVTETGVLTANSGTIGGLTMLPTGLSYSGASQIFISAAIAGTLLVSINERTNGYVNNVLSWIFKTNAGATFTSGYIAPDSIKTDTLLATSAQLGGAINAGLNNSFVTGRYLSTIKGGLQVDGLYVTNSKNRIVPTENYGVVGLNALESATCLFEDNGSGVINEDGLCYVFFDPVFKETINTKMQYYVQITKCGLGDIYVAEKHEDYFVVKGTSDLQFDYCVKATQKGYENDRLVRNEIHTFDEVEAENDADIRDLNVSLEDNEIDFGDIDFDDIDFGDINFDEI